MASIYHGEIVPGTDYATVFDKVYTIKNDAITVSSSFGNTATIIATCSSDGWLFNTAHNATCKSTLYICDVDGNNAVAIFSKELAASGVDRTSVFKKSIDITNLKGKRIYAYMHPNTKSGSAGVVINTSVYTEGFHISIVYDAIAGDKIKAGYMNQVDGQSATAGTTIANPNFTPNTKITASAFNTFSTT